MRSGRRAALAGIACLAAACGAPAGVAGVSTLPPRPPGVNAASPASGSATRPPGPAGPGRTAGQVAEGPVRVPPPTLSRFTYTFPVKGCRVSYSRTLLVLPKTTIWAGKGCAFVAPVDGVVREINIRNRWKPSTDRGPDREGRFVTVLGDDGVLYLGGHLDSVEPGLRPGTRVKVGQRLGRVGNSGNARDTASNLYFALSWPVPRGYWWIRRGMVKPWRYLDAWDDGNRTLSPRPETFALRRRLGTLPGCARLCASKPGAIPKETTPPKKADRDNTRVVVPLHAG